MAEQLGRYILDRKIAAGGMAEVFLARQSGPGGFEKICVIKRMLPTLGEDMQFVRMFLDEAKLAAYLNHPNIAQIFDFGQVAGTYFLAMEYVPGSTLRQIVKEHTKQGEFIPAHLCARMTSQAAIALDYAHNATDTDGNALNIIHRDVSPQNILLGNMGVVKLIDFGVAKAASASVKTATGMIKGKFAYMSPEQLRGKPLDKRSDVYGLGFVLYELLAGSRAIQGSTDAQMMDAALHRRFDPIEVRRPDVPPALKTIVERALAKEKEDRYDSCAELSADLERYLMSEGKAVTGRDLIALLSMEARLPLRFQAEETPGPTPFPSAPAGVVQQIGSGEFWSAEQKTEARTQIDPNFQPLARPAAAVPPALKPKKEPVLQPTATVVPKPDLVPPRTPTAPSQGAVVMPAGDDSKSLIRKAGLQKTLTPYFVAAAAVVLVLGGIGYALFSEDRIPVPVEQKKPVVVEQKKPEPVVVEQKKSEPVVVEQKKPEPIVVEEKKPDPVVVEQKLPEAVVQEQKPVVEEKKPHVVREKKPVVKTVAKVETTAAKATLRVTSSPQTSVFVDGVSLGRTPVETQLAVGDHELVFRDDKLNLKHSRTVRLERGDSRREEWRAGKGKVAFRVVPFGEVYLGQQWLGLTPLQPIDLYEGEYVFKFLNKDTGKQDSRTVKVEPDKETVVKVDLRAGT